MALFPIQVSLLFTKYIYKYYVRCKYNYNPLAVIPLYLQLLASLYTRPVSPC